MNCKDVLPRRVENRLDVRFHFQRCHLSITNNSIDHMINTLDLLVVEVSLIFQSWDNWIFLETCCEGSSWLFLALLKQLSLRMIIQHIIKNRLLIHWDVWYAGLAWMWLAEDLPVDVAVRLHVKEIRWSVVAAAVVVCIPPIDLRETLLLRVSRVLTWQWRLTRDTWYPTTVKDVQSCLLSDVKHALCVGRRFICDATDESRASSSHRVVRLIRLSKLIVVLLHPL